MLETVGYAFISTVIAIACAIGLTTDHARCPRGWFVNGVRPSGAFACLRDRAPSSGNEDSRGHDELQGRVDCEHPTFMPIVTDERSVSCGSTIP